jgi:phage baseplate assembly protein W
MSSARETDLDPKTYIGLSFPLRRDKFQDFAMTKNSLQQAEHNLKNLLLTYPGERVGQPTFGSRLRELCFEQIDDTLPQRIEEEVKKAVTNWLPYINLIEVATLTEEGDKNKIFVRVKYSTSLNPQTTQQIELDTSYTATIQ